MKGGDNNSHKVKFIVKVTNGETTSKSLNYWHHVAAWVNLMMMPLRERRKLTHNTLTCQMKCHVWCCRTLFLLTLHTALIPTITECFPPWFVYRPDFFFIWINSNRILQDSREKRLTSLLYVNLMLLHQTLCQFFIWTIISLYFVNDDCKFDFICFDFKPTISLLERRALQPGLDLVSFETSTEKHQFWLKRCLCFTTMR